MKIDKIVIGCHKGDLWLTKICVASIKFWYPERDVYLVKDLYGGEFDTSELEEHWGVKEHFIDDKRFGTSLLKIGLYVQHATEVILAIDSDLVFVGKVLEKLEECDSDFIVNPDDCDSPETEFFKRTYYNYELVAKADAAFRFPGYMFNCGQVVLTSGLFNKADFEPFVDWGDVPRLKNPEKFYLNDQGLLNYFLAKHEAAGRISISRIHFMHWSNQEPVRHIILDDIKKHEGVPFLVHWAGSVHPDVRKMKRSDILDFYQRHYYSRVPLGEVKRKMSNFHRVLRHGFKSRIAEMKRAARKCSPEVVVDIWKFFRDRRSTPPRSG